MNIDSIDALVAMADENEVCSMDLDEAVHDAKGDEAATINNDGLHEQIAYLVSRMGEDGVRSLLERDRR